MLLDILGSIGIAIVLFGCAVCFYYIYGGFDKS